MIIITLDWVGDLTVTGLRHA